MKKSEDMDNVCFCFCLSAYQVKAALTDISRIWKLEGQIQTKLYNIIILSCLAKVH